jgi:hypothetical protein
MGYTLGINKEQAEILCKALDLFSRVGCGEFEEILKHPTIAKRLLQGETQYARRISTSILDTVKQILTGHRPGSSIGITVADEPNRVAFDIFQVIRYQLAVDDNEHELSVHRHEPMKWSEQPLPIMKDR